MRKENSGVVEEVAKSITLLPRLMRYFFGSFKPKSDIKIKKNEVKTLFEIFHHPNMPMKYYVEAVDMETSSFTYLADNLAQKGLIKKTLAEKDKRKTVLVLTEEGRALCIQMKLEMDEHISEMIAVLEDENLEKLQGAFLELEAVLNQIEENTGKKIESCCGMDTLRRN